MARLHLGQPLGAVALPPPSDPERRAASLPDSAQDSADRRLSRGDRRWWLAAWLVVALAVGGRVHGVFAFPALQDYDAPGHLQYAYFLLQGELPPPSAWSGFHPPLYYAASALLWALAPEALPVHVAMRLLSLAAGLGAVCVVWRSLRARFSPADAALVTAVLLAIPFVALAFTMVGNETFCALFSTLVLARLLALPGPDEEGLVRHAAVTGLWVALAALSKSTGWVVGGVAGLAYLVQARRALPRALAAGLAIGLPALALAAPFYVRVALDGGGSPLGFLSGAAHSPDLAMVMSSQPPGTRELRHYLSFPLSVVTFPRFDGPGMTTSVPGMLHTAVWADGHGHYLWLTREVRVAAGVASAAGLLATALGIFGVVRLVRRGAGGELGSLLFLGLLLVALLRYTWVLPTYSAVKASYLVAALLPMGLVFAEALRSLAGWRRTLARGFLLLLALGDVALMRFGWWS